MCVNTTKVLARAHPGLPAQPVWPDLLLAMFTQACKGETISSHKTERALKCLLILHSYFQKHICVQLRANYFSPDSHVESIMNGIFNFSDISIYWFVLHSNWSHAAVLILLQPKKHLTHWIRPIGCFLQEGIMTKFTLHNLMSFIEM